MKTSEIRPAEDEQVAKWDDMAKSFMLSGDDYPSYNLHLIIRRMAAALQVRGARIAALEWAIALHHEKDAYEHPFGGCHLCEELGITLA